MGPQISIVTDGDSQYLTLTYRRRIDWSNSPETVGVSDNMFTWDDTQAAIETVGTVANNDGVTETVTVRLATPINQGPIRHKLLRLSLTQGDQTAANANKKTPSRTAKRKSKTGTANREPSATQQRVGRQNKKRSSSGKQRPVDPR